MSTRPIEISCAEVRLALSDYLENAVDPELRQRMEAHLRNCKECTAILDGMGNVIRLVMDGRAFDVPQGFSERLRDRLLAESKRR